MHKDKSNAFNLSKVPPPCGEITPLWGLKPPISALHGFDLNNTSSCPGQSKAALQGVGWQGRRGFGAAWLGAIKATPSARSIRRAWAVLMRSAGLSSGFVLSGARGGPRPGHNASFILTSFRSTLSPVMPQPPAAVTVQALEAALARSGNRCAQCGKTHGALEPLCIGWQGRVGLERTGLGVLGVLGVLDVPLLVVCVPCAWSLQGVVSLALANIPHGCSQEEVEAVYENHPLLAGASGAQPLH